MEMNEIRQSNYKGREKRYEKMFNQCFLCNDPNVVQSLYRKSNDGNKWCHPLILDYNHCMLCLGYSKSPYSLSLLYDSHIEIQDLYKFFVSKGIHFRYNKTDPIPKRIRRLIKSQNSKNAIRSYLPKRNNNRSLSDTDEYFDFKSKVREKLIKHKERSNSLSPKNSKPKKKNESNEIRLKTDNANIRTYKHKLKRQESEVQIINYFNHINHDDNESLSLTEYNDNKTFVINNPLLNEIYLNDVTDSNDKSKQSTCEICFQEPKDKFVLSCGDFFCKDCLRTYVLNCIKSISQFNKLYCPKEICKCKLSEREINELLSNEELIKYNKLKTRIEGLSNISLIPCPFPDCDSYCNKKKSKHKVKLCKCENNHQYCPKCLLIIKGNNHKEHRCKNKTKKDKTMEYLSKNRNIKQCPNCHCYIQRELAKGCNNMTCTNPWCGYRFCWICGKQYDDYHYRNPFTPCFGLSETDIKSKLARYKIMRIGKCILIFFLLIFIIFPLCLALFSILAVGTYMFAFVIDGSISKYIRIKGRSNKKVFKVMLYVVFACYSVAFIPLGYIVFALGIIALPIYCVVQRQMQIKHDAISEV